MLGRGRGIEVEKEVRWKGAVVCVWGGEGG